MGEGTSSTCYLGTNTETGENVAVKVYKSGKMQSKATLVKFKRQVEVLLELQQPFERPADESLWCEELAAIDPSDLFVKLLAYSKDAKGKPGPDATDQSMYVVTELADCTLKSVLKQRSQRNLPLPPDQARKFAKEILLAVAGLHVKGLVHLDLKPENIMLCGGRWKLIDMDGCVRVGTKVMQSDNSVSFSPCYCSPEFARFVSKGGSIVVQPGLDAWSVGMTLGELVNMVPLMRSYYQEISAGHSRKDGSSRFLQWLGSLISVPLPRRVCADIRLQTLLSGWLLVAEQTRRRTLAECMSAPYFTSEAQA